MTEYRVIVGNVGTVYEGSNGFEARKAYSDYKRMSAAGVGRASREPVILMRDGDIEWEFNP